MAAIISFAVRMYAFYRREDFPPDEAWRCSYRLARETMNAGRFH